MQSHIDLALLTYSGGICYSKNKAVRATGMCFLIELLPIEVAGRDEKSDERTSK